MEFYEASALLPVRPYSPLVFASWGLFLHRPKASSSGKGVEGV